MSEREKEYTKNKSFIDKLQRDLAKDKTEFKHFMTDAGKQFQDDFNSLMKFTEETNVIPNLSPLIIPVFNALKKHLEDSQKDDPLKVILKIVDKNDNILAEEIMEMKVLISDFFNSIKIPETFEPKIIDMTIRINSYYFLALRAYIDNYVRMLFELLVDTCCNPITIDFFKNLEMKGNPKDKLKSIRNKLICYPTDDFNLLLSGITWGENFSKFFKIRNKFAHEKPEAELSILIEHFPNIVDKMKGETEKKILNVLKTNPKLDPKMESEIKSTLIPIFHILSVLIKIGKECYGYLSFIDFMVYEFIKKDLIKNVD